MYADYEAHRTLGMVVGLIAILAAGLGVLASFLYFHWNINPTFEQEAKEAEQRAREKMGLEDEEEEEEEEEEEPVSYYTPPTPRPQNPPPQPRITPPSNGPPATQRPRASPPPAVVAPLSPPPALVPPESCNGPPPALAAPTSRFAGTGRERPPPPRRQLGRANPGRDYPQVRSPNPPNQQAPGHRHPAGRQATHLEDLRGLASI